MTQYDPVKTAARTLDVFEVFARAKTPLTLTELANLIGSPVSSCHALVKTLQSRGYVYVLDERKRVYPTKRLLAAAQEIARNDPVLERLAPVLSALLRESGETVILGKRQGERITYLEVLEGRHTIRYSAEPGDTKPLHSSAIGKAMLGTLREGELQKLLKKLPLASITGHTITVVDELVRDLREGRERGYFVTRGENVVEVMGVAIARSIGDEPYGLAVAGPVYRCEASLPTLVASLRKAGEALERVDAELSGAG